MRKWEYLTMVVNSLDNYGEEKIVKPLNGKNAAIRKDFFDRQFPSFYERISLAGQEEWELAGIENCYNKRYSIYVFKRLISCGSLRKKVTSRLIKKGCFYKISQLEHLKNKIGL